MAAEDDGRRGPGPRLIRSRDPRRAGGVALVLHGGGGRGTEPVSARQPAVLRMIPIAWRIGEVGRRRVAVFRLLNTYRGLGRRPLADVRWALDRLRRSHPGLPISLVGHSIGGTVALAAAGEPDVRSVVALAPWLSGADRFGGTADPVVLIVHGSNDHVTDPDTSARYAAAARADGRRVSYVRVEGGSHAMVGQRRAFELLAAQFVRITLAADPDGDAAERSGRGLEAQLERIARVARDEPGDYVF